MRPPIPAKLHCPNQTHVIVIISLIFVTNITKLTDASSKHSILLTEAKHTINFIPPGFAIIFFGVKEQCS